MLLLAFFLAGITVGQSGPGEPLRHSPHGELRASCDICHHPAGWGVFVGETRFSHDSTSYPLRGAHRIASCRDCHPTLRFAGVEAHCSSCHQDVHLGALGSDCSRCHTEEKWFNLDQVRRKHDEWRFPLQGRHSLADCAACHASGRFAGTPVECQSCHLADWRATSAPSHSASGIGTNCDACHSPASDWQAGTDHDRWFPIYSGEHRGEWRICADCHTNTANYNLFDCLGCHDRASTDRDHREVRSYSYDSQACFRCHPRGKAED